MRKPNDLPLVCLPSELPAEAVAELLAFLYELAAALERHYGAKLTPRHYRAIASAQRPADSDDPPF